MKKSIFLTLLCFGSFLFAASPTYFRVGEPIIVEKGVTVDSVLAIGGPVIVNGTVEHDVVSIGGPVDLGEHAVVFGDLVSVGGKVTQTLGARVLKLNKVEDTPQKKPLHFFRWVNLGWGMLALILVALFPAYIGRISLDLETKPMRMFFAGLLASFLVVPIAVTLVLTLVGIVLIPLEIAGVGLMIIFGATAVAQLIGKKLAHAFRRTDLPIVVETLIGLFAIFLVGLVPFLGALIKGLLGCAGLGAVSLSWFQWVRTPRV
jgi:hypothetical protein